MVSYQKRGLVLKRRGSGATNRQIRDLQKDLRQLGYLRGGIDGDFGSGTEMAVKGLQHDLLHNIGKSSRNEGDAPVSILDYNRGRVVDVTGEVDDKMAACISDMIQEPKFPKLPCSDNPREENSRILTAIKNIPSPVAPVPYLMAILKQESGLKHFHEPGKKDEDTYITIGLDRNASARHIITSRGYGAGQYTLFHHPPKKGEITDFMLNVEKNLEKAMNELREKLDIFVNGKTSGTRADDRIAERGKGKLVLCKYRQGDPPFMKDCKICMTEAGQYDIKEGITPYYKGSKHKFLPTKYYKKASYASVPVRKNIGCDWPYAVRRYNGSGINSYHYQVKILKNVFLS
jgi:peptidoglycan hydrolase-like protein with peptidoglycan-binding domain